MRSSRLSSKSGARRPDNDSSSESSSGDDASYDDDGSSSMGGGGGSGCGSGGGGGRKGKGTGFGDLGGNRAPLDRALNGLLDEAALFTGRFMDPSSIYPPSMYNPPLSQEEIRNAPLILSLEKNRGLGAAASAKFKAVVTGSGAAVRRGLTGHSAGFTMTCEVAHDMKRCRDLWVFLFVSSCELHGGVPRWEWTDTFLNSKLPWSRHIAT